jgi:flagellar FliL protein
MATKPAAASPATPAGAAATDEAPPKSRKKLVLILLAVLLLGGGGAGGWFFWQSRQSEGAKPAPPPPLLPLIFLPLNPPFVANFEEGQPARFLQVDVRLASRSPETIELLRANEPLLRNDLLLLYGAQDAAALGSREGKEKLRAESLETVRRIVKDLRGDPRAVESVLFASFVMQ